jgi:hypothetical protein
MYERRTGEIYDLGYARIYAQVDVKIHTDNCMDTQTDTKHTRSVAGRRISDLQGQQRRKYLKSQIPHEKEI